MFCFYLTLVLSSSSGFLYKVYPTSPACLLYFHLLVAVFIKCTQPHLLAYVHGPVHIQKLESFLLTLMHAKFKSLIFFEMGIHNKSESIVPWDLIDYSKKFGFLLTINSLVPVSKHLK